MSDAPVPRIFISSVVDGFQAFRDAAADGVRVAGMEPIRVNEDSPALPSSSRNACLDAIDSCDGFVSILGARAGWKAPSGKYVIEEEFDHAARRGMPVYVYLQNVDRDTEAERIAKSVSEYVHGTFRVTFDSPADLRAQVQRSLTQSPPSTNVSVPNEPLRAALERDASSGRQSGAPVLRMTVASARADEWFDPLRLASSSFADEVILTGVQRPFPLFSLRAARDVSTAPSALRIHQPGQRQGSGDEGLASVLLTPRGPVVVERAAISVDADPMRRLSLGLVVTTAQLQEAGRALFQFAAKLLDLTDPYLRHRQLYYNVALQGLGPAKIYDVPPPQGQGIPLRMVYGSATGDVIVAFDEGRPIARDALSSPAAEIDRAVALLKGRSDE